jgi:hypothetical protein
MFTSVRRRTIAVAATASVLAFGLSALPASAQTRQSGAVNVAVIGTTIQVPIGVAANVCNVTANVIAANNFTPNGGPCNAISSPSAGGGGGGGGGGGSTSQQGLVNVLITNTTIQIPVAVAANVCNVTANVIASGNFTPNGSPCMAVSTPGATL